jgi:hypothetical protein
MTEVRAKSSPDGHSAVMDSRVKWAIGWGLVFGILLGIGYDEPWWLTIVNVAVVAVVAFLVMIGGDMLRQRARRN